MAKIFLIFIGLFSAFSVKAAPPSVTLDISPNPATIYVDKTTNINVLADGNDIMKIYLFIDKMEVDMFDCMLGGKRVSSCWHNFARPVNAIGEFSVYAVVRYLNGIFTADVESNTQKWSVVATPPQVSAPHIDSISPTSGSVGQDVMILGSNFNPYPALNFAYFNTTRVSGISGGGNFFVVKVPQLSNGTVNLSVKSFDTGGSGNLLDSDNSVNFEIIGGGNTVPATCQYLSCEAANPVGCECGGVTTVGTALWCCAGSSGATNNQESCKKYSACAGPTTPSQPSGSGLTIQNPLKANNFEDLVNYLIKFVFYIALAIAPLMIIIAGFFWITSAGDPARVKTAQTIILYTSIGLAVILLARGLIAIIKSVLGG